MKAHLEYMDTWTSMDIYGLDTHGPMDSHGHPWKLMESHRNPSNFTELSGAGVHFSCVTPFDTLCHGMTSLPLLHPPLAASDPFHLHSTPMSQTTPGCVTRHTRHASVTHFRPILGNIVEVTLVTSPKHVYNSHAKETYFP